MPGPRPCRAAARDAPSFYGPDQAAATKQSPVIRASNRETTFKKAFCAAMPQGVQFAPRRAGKPIRCAQKRSRKPTPFRRSGPAFSRGRQAPRQDRRSAPKAGASRRRGPARDRCPAPARRRWRARPPRARQERPGGCRNPRPGIRAGHQQVRALAPVAMRDPGRDHDDIPGPHRHFPAQRAAERDPHGAGGDAKHLVRRAVEMVEAEDAVPPSVRPTMRRERALHRVRVGRKRAAVDEQRQGRVREPAVIREPVGFCAAHAGTTPHAAAGCGERQPMPFCSG